MRGQDSVTIDHRKPTEKKQILLSKAVGECVEA